jgi:hypothetical protein
MRVTDEQGFVYVQAQLGTREDFINTYLESRGDIPVCKFGYPLGCRCASCHILHNELGEE